MAGQQTGQSPLGHDCWPRPLSGHFCSQGDADQGEKSSVTPGLSQLHQLPSPWRVFCPRIKVAALGNYKPLRYLVKGHPHLLSPLTTTKRDSCHAGFLPVPCPPHPPKLSYVYTHTLLGFLQDPCLYQQM